MNCRFCQTRLPRAGFSLGNVQYSGFFPAEGEASLCGAIIEANPKNGLASNVSQFIFGGELQKEF